MAGKARKAQRKSAGRTARNRASTAHKASRWATHTWIRDSGASPGGGRAYRSAERKNVKASKEYEQAHAAYRAAGGRKGRKTLAKRARKRAHYARDKEGFPAQPNWHGGGVGDPLVTTGGALKGIAPSYRLF